METKNIHETLKQINAELERISEELSRPDEDVVTISVCHGSRHVVSELMHLYLSHKGKSVENSSTLTGLLEACNQQSGAFASISLNGMACSDMHHSSCNGKYCLDLANVQDCVSTASRLKSIILDELAISENDI